MLISHLKTRRGYEWQRVKERKREREEMSATTKLLYSTMYGCIPKNNELASVSFSIQISQNRIFMCLFCPISVMLYVLCFAVKLHFYVASPKWWSDILLSGQQRKNMLRLKTLVIVKWLKLIASFLAVNLLQLINYNNFGVNYIIWNGVVWKCFFFCVRHNKLYKITVIGEIYAMFICAYVCGAYRTDGTNKSAGI